MVSLGDLSTWYRRAQKERVCRPTRQVRDLTLVELGEGFSLVVAVDSDGGIGALAHDVVKVPGYLVGRFALRVPLLELLCCGAAPLAAFDMLTVSMDAYGEEILRGLRDTIREAGLPPDFPLSGSTEENVATSMTGVGTAALGIVREEDFRPGTSSPGDVLLCVGFPKSAPEDEISLEDPEIVRFSDVRMLLGTEGVHDLLPVGSRGIAHEAAELARAAGLQFGATSQPNANLNRSGGPATCLLVSVEERAISTVRGGLKSPVFEVGTLHL